VSVIRYLFLVADDGVEFIPSLAACNCAKRPEHSN